MGDSDSDDSIVIEVEDGLDVPTRMSKGSSNYDLSSTRDGVLLPGEVSRLDLGVKMRLPPAFYAQVQGKSGLALRGIHVHPTVLDGNYRGDISLVIQNMGHTPFYFYAGETLARLLVCRCVATELMLKSVNEDGTHSGFKSNER